MERFIHMFPFVSVKGMGHCKLPQLPERLLFLCKRCVNSLSRYLVVSHV